jgi:hypothetical protein
MTIPRFVHRSLQIDEELDAIDRDRSRLLAGPPSPRRSECLARSFQREAEVWSFVFTHTGSRLYWRAALKAEVEARRAQRYWNRRAVEETLTWPLTVVIPGATTKDSHQAAMSGRAS